MSRRFGFAQPPSPPPPKNRVTTRLSIVMEGGSMNGTRVINSEGQEVEGVQAVHISHRVGSVATVRLDLIFPTVEIAQAMVKDVSVLVMSCQHCGVNTPQPRRNPMTSYDPGEADYSHLNEVEMASRRRSPSSRRRG